MARTEAAAGKSTVLMVLMVLMVVMAAVVVGMHTPNTAETCAGSSWFEGEGTGHWPLHASGKEVCVCVCVCVCVRDAVLFISS